MASKVRVNAKSQKWAALGVIDAYMKMYPHATLEDLNKAFPRSIFVDSEPNMPLLVTMAESSSGVYSSSLYTMPKRSRRGAESMPKRVVAPMRVKRGTGTRRERAVGPLPIMISMAKSSMAG